MPRRRPRTLPDALEGTPHAVAADPAAADVDVDALVAAILDSSHPRLLVTVDEAVDKDSEMHSLVRWQFVGGLKESERRAFLFRNIVNARGRKYDLPIVVGALAANAPTAEQMEAELGLPAEAEVEAEAGEAAGHVPAEEVRQED